ncbi:MAG: 16S rRNA (adenine(1518)-N(6)/adenine(1519)-N(6))-dimethyltransferase RsmA [Synechococcales cyanobacterium RU_4_20]|nr:16S rRNA (adenine(1518)-N(6)/adenine(1519)-N(6))-dimethyltransferase RsmA [Synechococcales cyanobacterium RU_4_20]NJR69105.1 16S rRNA (adenine(1518)-N(6)/adenine(1519)-N(6))-dimethyltransferase RsmA [Synechococcales cyanobacterium CRU_2_2]
MPSNPRKQFGQHWLRSPAALQSIIGAASVEVGDRILEIGPGEGVLTRELLSRAKQVIAVEIDRDLCANLRKSFDTELRSEKLSLVEGDFLSLSWNEVMASSPDLPPDLPPNSFPKKVVANIPYNITGPILERLLGRISTPRLPTFKTIVLLVQKEVAERICAKSGSKSFGALTVRMQYLADCEWICAVPARAFYPPPKVDSAVIRLRPRPCPTPAEDPNFLESLVKLGFTMKRKMLRNNLKGVVEGDRLQAILVALGAKPEARGEELTLEQWVGLSNRLGAGQETAMAKTTKSETVMAKN